MSALNTLAHGDSDQRVAALERLLVLEAGVRRASRKGGREHPAALKVGGVAEQDVAREERPEVCVRRALLSSPLRVLVELDRPHLPHAWGGE